MIIYQKLNISARGGSALGGKNQIYGILFFGCALPFLNRVSFISNFWSILMI